MAGQRLCGAKTRAGTPCKFVAGFKTDHVGQGRCHLHGGLTPIRTGRYSTITRPALAQRIAEQEADPTPLDTLPEIRLVRALLIDFVERYDPWRDALLAWHESWKAGMAPLDPAQVLALRAVLDEYEEREQGGDGLTDKQAADLAAARACVERLAAGAGDGGGKPHQVLDVADAYRMAGEVTKMVERVERTYAASAITLPDLERLMFEMGRIVKAHVDERAAATILEAWLALRV